MGCNCGGDCYGSEGGGMVMDLVMVVMVLGVEVTIVKVVSEDVDETKMYAEG